MTKDSELTDLLKRKQTLKQAFRSLEGLEVTEKSGEDITPFSITDARKEFAIVEYWKGGGTSIGQVLLAYGSGKFYSFSKMSRSI